LTGLYPLAACELLRQLNQGIERVLVVSTASLKTEWEEKISKFVDLPVTFIQGARLKDLNDIKNLLFLSYKL